MDTLVDTKFGTGSPSSGGHGGVQANKKQYPSVSCRIKISLMFYSLMHDIVLLA